MMHRRWPVAMATAMVFAVAAHAASSAPAEQTPVSCAERLQAGLEQLVDLPAAQWRFVVLDETETGHFIQYAWWNGVVVDLPLAALNEAQQARAASEFASLGVSTPVEVSGADGSSDKTLTFQFDFGRDTAAAARFGCEALPRIFVLADDARLKVTVGGD